MSLILIMTIMITILFGEVISYLHHRFVSHDLRTGSVHQTHKAHHVMWKNDKEHKAYEDFAWVALVLIFAGLFLSLRKNVKGLVPDYIYGIIPDHILYTVFGTMIVFSVYKAYIHAAYHTPGHYLNRFELFREWKRLHELHHINPKCNYSISCYSTDIFFETFMDKN